MPAKEVCGNCRWALDPAAVKPGMGYQRLDHGKRNDQRFCRLTPRHPVHGATIVHVDEPCCSGFRPADEVQSPKKR
jgi:hypothetical protein